jgi:hypothetical protein
VRRIVDNPWFAKGGPMSLRTTAVAASVMVLLAGCASQWPEKDAEVRPEKVYRTGSNLPTKDYGAANIEVGKPDTANPMQRPGTGVLGRKGGG